MGESARERVREREHVRVRVCEEEERTSESFETALKSRKNSSFCFAMGSLYSCRGVPGWKITAEDNTNDMVQQWNGRHGPDVMVQHYATNERNTLRTCVTHGCAWTAAGPRRCS
jgi:hypothetical protein